jgi:hypothetical protein
MVMVLGNMEDENVFSNLVFHENKVVKSLDGSS